MTARNNSFTIRWVWRAARRIFRRIGGAMFGRFSLSLTIEGYCLVAAMLLIGLAALNTAAPLLYMMFSMMCAFFVLSALLATNTIRDLEVSREMPRTWMAGRPMRVALRIRNNKRFSSSYCLRVQDFQPGGDALGATFFDRIPAGRTESKEDYECLFLQRGVYRVSRLEIATRFPFGLIERRLTHLRPQELMIFPQTIAVESAMKAVHAELGDMESVRRGSGAGIYGLREYTQELSARDIHWKVSARRGLLMAREYEAEERRRACVILDNRIAADEQPAAAQSFEKAVVLAASVIEWLLRREHEVELRTASGVVAFGAGQTHLSRCLRALAEIKMIKPEQSDPKIIYGMTFGVVNFPILMNEGNSAAPGSFPLAISQFEHELHEAFRPKEFLTDGGATSAIMESKGMVTAS